jgi:dynein-related subfamily AAA family protein
MSQAVTIQQLKYVVRQLAEKERLGDLAIYVSGPPGIGKTALFEQLAKEIGAAHDVYLACTMDPTDISGLPFPMRREGITKFFPPDRLLGLTQQQPCAGPTIAVFDDLPACEERVFFSLYRFFHERYVGKWEIRDDVLLVATGNRVADMAGAKELPTALANRFVHFELAVDLEEWIQWSYRNNVDPMIIGFIQSTQGRMLHDFDPARGDVCFPSPRSVVNASIMYQVLDRADQRQLKSKLIPVEVIFGDPNGAPIPEDLDVMWAVVSNVICATARDLKAEKIDAALRYGLRFDDHRDIGAKLCKDVTNLVATGQHTEMFDLLKDALTLAKRKYGSLLSLRGNTGL